MNVKVKLSEVDNFKISFGEVIQGGCFPYYDGEYTVTPKPTSQTLETANKSMRQNVEIEEVPYAEVSNPEGGKTVNIAYIT